MIIYGNLITLNCLSRRYRNRPTPLTIICAQSESVENKLARLA